MIRSEIPALGLACLIAAAIPAHAQEAATCDGATNRCTSLVRLVGEGEQTFAAVSLQADRTGAEPVLFVTAPLGIAARPGVRIVASPGAAEIALPLDVCFPDGCRASAELTAEQLAALAGAESLSVQFIPFSGTETLGADLEAARLVDPLKAAGVTLP